MPAALDQLGERARERLAGVPEGAARVERLNRFLFGEEGFAGASEYYDPRNSYLNEVLARRCGIPITLAIVYIAVARRAGLDARGISFPGHFLVRCAGRDEQIIDAFHGRTISLAEIEARLANALGPDAALRPELHLRDASAREILVRMLANLQRIFAGSGDAERLLACCDRIVLLTPARPDRAARPRARLPAARLVRRRDRRSRGRARARLRRRLSETASALARRARRAAQRGSGRAH